MSFNTLTDDDDVMSEINMTPLVDVMLVLLIIFMLTVPVMQHSVKLDLPKANNQQNDLTPKHVNLAVKFDGTMSWNGKSFPDAELESRIQSASKQDPQPELHLYVDKRTQYEKLAQVMAIAQSNGLRKIGFVTEPKWHHKP